MKFRIFPTNFWSAYDFVLIDFLYTVKTIFKHTLRALKLRALMRENQDDALAALQQ